MISSVRVSCPYCGQTIALAVDASAGDQDYTEDCQVCCRPMVVAVWIGADGDPAVRVQSEDEA